ncbi:hypothetical protein D3C78_1538220 [compost metagenome]
MRTTRQSVFQLFNHHHTAAAGDDETVTGRVVSTRSFLRSVVVAGGQCAHRIELTGHFPAQLFAAAGKDHVLLAQLDQFNRVANAVCRGCAGRADGIVNATNFERGCQAGGNA